MPSTWKATYPELLLNIWLFARSSYLSSHLMVCNKTCLFTREASSRGAWVGCRLETAGDRRRRRADAGCGEPSCSRLWTMSPVTRWPLWFTNFLTFLGTPATSFWASRGRQERCSDAPTGSRDDCGASRVKSTRSIPRKSKSVSVDLAFLTTSAFQAKSIKFTEAFLMDVCLGPG